MTNWRVRIAGIGLKRKLMLLFMVISIIPLVILGLLSFNQASFMVQQKSYQAILESLSQTTVSINYMINDVEQLSMYIYRNHEVQQALSTDREERSAEAVYRDEQRIKAMLESLIGFKNWDIEIYILGVNGERYFTGRLLPKQYDAYDPEWGLFRKAQLAGGNTVWDTHYTFKKLYDFGTALSAGRLLKNIETNETLGYLVIDIMESALVDQYSKAQLYPGGHIYMLDKFGNVISSSPKHQIGTKLKADYVPKVLEGTRGYFQTNDGREVVIYDTSDTTGFKVIRVVPVKEVIKDSESIRILTVGMLLIGSLTAYWFAASVSSHIANPLSKLRLLMKQVEKGDLSVAFPSKYTDEVGQLGQSFNRMVGEIQYLIRENYEKQLQLREAELKAIQAQINPHFLYNTLDSINWMARIHQIDEISNTVISLGELLRYSIRKGNQIITIQEDMNQIRHYLSIQQMRFRDKIRVEFQVDEAILPLYTLKLLIQPIVENAVVHGLENKKGSGTLCISGALEDGRVRFTIQDDGIGFRMQDEAPDQRGVSRGSTGIGLENVSKRLQLQFGDQASLQVWSEPGTGTTVKVVIPQIQHAGDMYV